MGRIKLTLQDIFNIPTAVIYNPDSYRPVSAVAIDSRNITANSLFVAIKGERFDGHDFVKEAVKKGASCVMVDEKKYKRFGSINLPVVTVSDTTLALGDLAKCWRQKLDAKVIGITGSAGKTSTKEILATLLGEKYKVNKTKANNNNNIGVPLTVFDTNSRHEILVLEMGTNHFGEISYTADIALPDYALITNIGSSHLEFLKNKKGVLKEKIALFDAAASVGGTLFVNNDDELIKAASSKYSKKISFGFEKKSDIKGKIAGYNDEGRAEIEISYKNKKIKTGFPLYGEGNAKNYLAASAVALKLGLNKKEIISGTAKLKAYSKRLNVKKIKDVILIDDTYNANPDSMKYSLNLLGRIKTKGRKIAVLGDMFELGADGKKLHKSLYTAVRKNKIDEIYTIGPLMKNLNEAVMKSVKNTRHFRTRKAMENFLAKHDFGGSVVLVKGSRGMKMEEFVNVIEAGI